LAIATKNGFVEVLVINVTPIGPAAEPPAAWLAVEELVPVELAGELPEQAANNMAAVARVDTAPRRLPVVEWVTAAPPWCSGRVGCYPNGTSMGRVDNVVIGL